MVELVEEIYQWKVDLINSQIDGAKTTGDFVKEFLEITKKFLSDLLEKFQGIFQFVENFPIHTRLFFYYSLVSKLL
jgi:hypothetical protein